MTQDAIDVCHKRIRLADTLIGGFHSPMEKECLDLLLRGSRPIIICPARSIDRMRIPKPWKAPLADGRLLVMSPFLDHRPRAGPDVGHPLDAQDDDSSGRVGQRGPVCHILEVGTQNLAKEQEDGAERLVLS